MLGQGLESLIPQQDDANDDAGYPLDPQGGVSDDAPRTIGDAPPAVPLVTEETHTAPSPQPAPAPVAPQTRPEQNYVSQPQPQPQTQPKPLAPPLAEKSKKPAQEFIFHIEVSKIEPNPNQPRRKFAEQGIRELAYSVREFGFLQPIVVSKIEKETPAGVEVQYQLITGERRLLAAKMLGLETVPAIVRAVDLEREKLEMAVIENIQREDLNPIETARAFARLQEEFRMTQREIAAKLGKSREVVANAVRLLDLPIYVQEALESGQISESHGRLLLAITDPGAQKKLFDDILANNLTTRDLRQRVEVMKPRKRRGTEELSPELKIFEEKLSAELGAPVKIERGINTGKILITFFSEEELENIVRKIGRETGENY